MDGKVKIFTCDRCGANFKRASHLAQHSNRKTPCVVNANDVANAEHRCIYCNRNYSTKFNLTKHQNICKMKHGGVINIPDPNIRIAEQLRILNEEREREKEDQKRKEEEHKQEIMELREMIKEMMTRQPPASIGTMNVNIGDHIGTQNIVINNYNTPNVDHLLEFETFRKMFGRADIDLPVEIVLCTYFDPSHPENASIHLIDKETKHVLAKVNGQWNTFTMEKIVGELRDIGYKYASEGIKKHINPEYPDRCAYIRSKTDVINQIRNQKISPKSRDYEIGLIEDKMITEFVASAQHPAVVADKERKKQAIADAKRGSIM